MDYLVKIYSILFCSVLFCHLIPVVFSQVYAFALTHHRCQCQTGACVPRSNELCPCHTAASTLLMNLYSLQKEIVNSLHLLSLAEAQPFNMQA